MLVYIWKIKSAYRFAKCAAKNGHSKKNKCGGLIFGELGNYK